MEYPITKGKPSFKEKNDIAPVAQAKKKNAALQTSLFGDNALKSEIKTSPNYASKTKGTVDKSVSCLDANSIWPDNKCC